MLNNANYVDMVENMKKTTSKSSNLVAKRDPNAQQPKDVSDSMTKDQICDHDWQPDGQTMTSVRYICIKCHKTQMNGLEI